MDIKKFFDKKMIIALGAGLGAALIATSVFVMIGTFKTPEPKSSKTVEIRVLKATKDIARGGEITPEMVTYTSVPAENARMDMIVDHDQIANLKTAKDIKAETLLSKSDFVSIVPTSIPKGYIAMSVEINTVSGVTWMLKEGDTVDVIGVLRPTESSDKRGTVSKVQLQAIRVLAVESPQPKNDKQIGTAEKGTITLLMTPEQAQKMMLVSTAGNYTLALRGVGDDEQYRLNPVSIPEMIQTGKTGTVIETPKTAMTRTVEPKRAEVRSPLTVVEVK